MRRRSRKGLPGSLWKTKHYQAKAGATNQQEARLYRLFFPAKKKPSPREASLKLSMDSALVAERFFD